MGTFLVVLLPKNFHFSFTSHLIGFADLPIITTKKREILTVSLYESDGKVSYAYFAIQGGYKEAEMIKILFIWGPSP